MNKHIVFLGIGSNLGKRERQIEESIELIDSRLGRVLNCSTYHYSSPQGFSSIHDFANVVLQLQTELSPQDLLLSIQQIEQQLGRVRKTDQRYADRTIDIDILFYDDLVIETEQLEVPHPRLSERGFVLLPLMEIAPDLLHPVWGCSIATLVDNWRAKSSSLLDGYPTKQHTVQTKRYCQTLELKNDPQLISQYVHCHSQDEIWSEVLSGIRQVGILDMEIYLLGTKLFMIVETALDFDWDIAFEQLADLPRQKEWETYVSLFQATNPSASSSQKWQRMERIFHLYD